MGKEMNDNNRIDREKALHWLEGDERMFARIKAIFIKNVPSQVEHLKECLESGDNGAAERIAHTVMGSSAMLGAGGMSEEARKIEMSCIEADMDSALLNFTRFYEEYEKVMSELINEGDIR